MNVIFVGATFNAHPAYEQFLPEPTAPSNYKDQAKIDAYIAKAREGLLGKALETPMACSVVDWAISFDNGDSPVEGKGSVEFIKNLTTTVGPDTRVVGLGVKHLLDTARIEAIDHLLHEEGSDTFLLSGAVADILFGEGFTPFSERRVIDPLRAIMGSTVEESLALHRLGIMVKPGALGLAEAANRLWDVL
jgi:hypothetical protein